MADFSILTNSDLFQSCKSTLKETSYDDDNDGFLCQSDKEVYNFDEITEKEFGQCSSFDAIWFYQNEVYCMEFKNSERKSITSKTKKKIRKKYNKGFKNLKIIFENYNLAVKDYSFYFFVIYKNPSNSNKRLKHIEYLMREKVKFKLEKIKAQNMNEIIFQKSYIKTTCKEHFKREYKQIFV